MVPSTDPTYSSSTSQNRTHASAFLIVQDVLEKYWQKSGNNNDDDDDVSMAFFELANAPELGYRIRDEQLLPLPLSSSLKTKSSGSRLLRFHQDHSCGQHTGGIVWETSVLLLHYLLHAKDAEFDLMGTSDNDTATTPTIRVAELGAGCGLLGQALVAMAQVQYLVQTETSQVLRNLLDNRNVNFGGALEQQQQQHQQRIHCCALDWTRYRQDVAASALLAPHSFDTLLGTDVIFAPALVEPLWQCIDFIAKKQGSAVYICVQVRCAVSHACFLTLATKYGFCLQDLTERLADHPETAWGLTLECHLYRLYR
jgi:predicted nicotinamide N-methyase